MKRLQAIAAMSLNRVIGAGNQMPWHLPEDFKWFKQLTTGHVVVMGRRTFEAIGKPLPNRETVVLSRGPFAFPGVRVLHSLDDLIQAQAVLETPLVTSLPQNQSSPSPQPSPPLRTGERIGRKEASRFEPLNQRALVGSRGGSGTGVSPVRVETHGRDARATTRFMERVSTEREVFICGGAQVYEQTLPLCSDLYLTLVKRIVEGDAFFPPFEDKFELVKEIRDTPEFKILHYRNRAP